MKTNIPRGGRGAEFQDMSQVKIIPTARGSHSCGFASKNGLETPKNENKGSAGEGMEAEPWEGDPNILKVPQTRP